MSQFIEHNRNEPRTSTLSCIDNYEFHRSLGKGSMGKVKLGVHIVTGEKVMLSPHLSRPYKPTI